MGAQFGSVHILLASLPQVIPRPVVHRGQTCWTSPAAALMQRVCKDVRAHEIIMIYLGDIKGLYQKEQNNEDVQIKRLKDWPENC